jgi:hypothetical protein
MKIVIVDFDFIQKTCLVGVHEVASYVAETGSGYYMDGNLRCAFDNIVPNIPAIDTWYSALAEKRQLLLRTICRERDVNTTLASLSLVAEGICGSMHIVDNGLINQFRMQVFNRDFDCSDIDYNVKESLRGKGSEINELTIDDIEFLERLLSENYHDCVDTTYTIEKRDGKYIMNGEEYEPSVILDYVVRSNDAIKYTKHIHDVLCFELKKKNALKKAREK